MLQIDLIASLFVLFGQSHAGINLKACEINAVMKRKDSNCVGILSDQGKAATASNKLRLGLNYTRFLVQHIDNFSLVKQEQRDRGRKIIVQHQQRCTV